MVKIGIHTLGCKVNQAESEDIKNELINKGFSISNAINSDIHIINSCTVTHIADAKSRKIIRKIRKNNPSSKIILTGCYANTSDIKDILHVDFVVKNEDKFKIPNIILSQYNNKNYNHQKYFPSRYFPSRTRIFLKIQDGCNQFCSYCIVPYIRSNIYSVDVEDILSKIRKMPKKTEVVLCGIRLGLYQGKFKRKKIYLPQLIEIISKEENVLRLRLSSIEPQDVSDELIDVFTTTDKLCPHLHLPLQSGDDEILHKMNRKYTTEYYYNLVEKLKNKIKNLTLTTDIIVGFPTETDKHFSRSYEFIKRIDFLKMHIFKYSKRDKTLSTTFPNHCSEKEKKERSKILLKLSDEKNFLIRKKYLGEILQVLVEGKDKKNNLHCGYSENYIKIHFNDTKSLAEKIVKTKITDVNKNITYGIIIQ